MLMVPAARESEQHAGGRLHRHVQTRKIQFAALIVVVQVNDAGEVTKWHRVCRRIAWIGAIAMGRHVHSRPPADQLHRVGENRRCQFVKVSQPLGHTALRIAHKCRGAGVFP
jgi:hypothetical protein